MAQFHQPISIRNAFPDDTGALRRLAAMDSARLPADPLVVAEIGGEIQAALSLRDGRVIADPFQPTAGLVVLLEVHAAQAGRSPWTLARGRSAIRTAAAVWRGLTERSAAQPPLLGGRRPAEPRVSLAAHGLLRAP